MEDEILNGTFYEWDMEYCTEYGDIDRHDHAVKLKELETRPHSVGEYDDGMWSRLVLIQTVYRDGDMKDQSWAYVSNGQLPLTTDGGAKVPQKYHKEFNKHIEWAGKFGNDQVPWEKNLEDHHATKTSKAEGVDTMPKQEEKVQATDPLGIMSALLDLNPNAVETPVKENKRTTYTRKPKVETPAEKVLNWDGKKFAKQVEKNVTSTGDMINEMERVAKESMIHYLNVSQDPDLELIDIDKFKTLITLESPKNSAGTHKKDSITRGHFTKTDEWTDSKGVTYRAINLNPYLLESMGVDGLIGTIYHETIHAFADWKDVSDVGKNGKHNKKFEEFANASGIIEATKVEDYRGFETGLTKEGKKWAKGLKFNTKLFFKTLPDPKDKPAPKPKRGNLECSECGFEVSLPLGKYVDQLSKVVENLPAVARRLDIDGIPFTLKDYAADIPVINCIADGNGMMPSEKHIEWFQLQCDLEEAVDEGDEE